jgi:hypothetical protein
LTSITSVRYQLAALGVEKVPKDPFGTPRKFLYIWRSCQQSMDKPIPRSEYLCVPGIRALNAAYIAGRYKTHATDALKVHRLIISGVTSATNNLRGNTADDGTTPLRKREQHKHFHGSHDSESGVGMIVTYTKPEPAAPDVITTDLEAYRKLIMQSREREWDAMGARRVAELWSGVTAKHGPDHGNRQHGRLQAFRRRVTKNKDDKDAETDDDTPPSAIGAFKGMRDRTGAAIKGGFGLVGYVNDDHGCVVLGCVLHISVSQIDTNTVTADATVRMSMTRVTQKAPVGAGGSSRLFR